MNKLKEKLSFLKEKKNKKIVINICAVLALMLIVTGTTIAGGYWSYISKDANSISTGEISLTYLESTSEINLTNALPMSDNDGKLLSKKGAKFEFAITTNSDYSQVINYDINIEPLVVDTGLTGLDPSAVKVYLEDKEGNQLVSPVKLSELNNFNLYSTKHIHKKGGTKITSKYVLRAWIDKDVVASDWYNEYKSNNTKYQYKFRVNVNGEGAEYVPENIDKSGANKPALDEGMIPVYYDETSETWKKADETNKDEDYKWYDYNNKMWANSVTVSSTNRSTYQSASLGTEIPMDDILTMQVWIPRYKYKVWNYNSDGTVKSNPQEIEISFEDGTAKTGEISCQDSISGTDGAPSETCKLKSTNATCTDSTCNNKYYTHPAFTFGEEELKGFWIGKFELTGTISSITTKPNLTSLRDQRVGDFSTNIMKMNDSGNIYGLSTTTDTHMIKNMEWGAVAYLSHSKYGTCTSGTCKEVNINNSEGYYTGRSGGNPFAESLAEGTYKYNQTKEEKTIMSGGTEIKPTVTNNETPAWTVTDGVYKSATQGVNSSTTNISFNFTAPNNNTYLSFDWSVSSESASYDYLYYTITKDGTALSDTGTSTQIGGTTLGTTEAALRYINVSRKLEAGSYILTFTYRKDGSGAEGTDTGYIKNIKVLDTPKEETKITSIGEGKDGPSASTTHNIYGVYDMSGGAYEYVMGNMVSNDGSTMMSGQSTSFNSGYTGIIYDSSSGSYTSYTGTYSYPNAKYYDKYSFGTSNIQRIRSKLGDSIKEVLNTSTRGWYTDSSSLAWSNLARGNPSWFTRGDRYGNGTSAGAFSSDSSIGEAMSNGSSRLVITP